VVTEASGFVTCVFVLVFVFLFLFVFVLLLPLPLFSHVSTVDARGIPYRETIFLGRLHKIT